MVYSEPAKSFGCEDRGILFYEGLGFWRGKRDIGEPLGLTEGLPRMRYLQESSGITVLMEKF